MAPPRKLPPHPARKFAVILILLGATLAIFGVLGLANASADGALRVGAGVVLLASGVFVLRAAGAVQLVNSALDHVGRGLLDDAEGLLDAASRTARDGHLARAIAMQRSMIALRRDDTAGAVAHATRAIDVRLGLFGHDAQRIQIANAYGLRAVASASKGDSASAHDDMMRVRSLPCAMPESLALAAVSEVIVYARANDRAALVDALAKNRRLLLELTTPRDRALIRALQRMSAANPSTVYREAASREAHRDAPGDAASTTGWIARAVPDAAAFSGAEGRHAATTPDVGLSATPDANAMAGVERARQSAVKKAGFTPTLRLLAMWGALLTMYFAISRFLAPSYADCPSPSGPPWFLLLGGCVVAPAAIVVWAFRRRAANAAIRASAGTTRGTGLGCGFGTGAAILGIILFLAAWQFLNPPEPPHHRTRSATTVATATPQRQASRVVHPAHDAMSPVVIGLLVVGLCGAAILFTLRGNRSANARVIAARRLLALDNIGPAEQAFAELSKSRLPLVAAQGEVQLAQFASRRAAWREVIDHCDRGIGRILTNRTAAIAAADLISPMLGAERAFALAASGMVEEATAELAALAKAYPAFPLKTATMIRVQMVQALKRGDIAEARHLAHQRSADLPLSYRDELLADVLLATSGEHVDARELARLQSDLSADEELRRWLSNIHPNAEAALASAHATAMQG